MFVGCSSVFAGFTCIRIWYNISARNVLPAMEYTSYARKIPRKRPLKHRILSRRCNELRQNRCARSRHHWCPLLHYILWAACCTCYAHYSACLPGLSMVLFPFLQLTTPLRRKHRKQARDVAWWRRETTEDSYISGRITFPHNKLDTFYAPNNKSPMPPERYSLRDSRHESCQIPILVKLNITWLPSQPSRAMHS